MYPVRAKKHLGQHFLKDENIAQKIVASLLLNKNVLEIGAGTGVLTKYLKDIPEINLKIIEIDKESIIFLKNNFPEITENIIQSDFLRYDLKTLFNTFFIRQVQGKICIFDIKEMKDFNDDDVREFMRILSMFTGSKIKVVTGKHYGQIVSSSGIDERVELYLSSGDLDLVMNDAGLFS